MKSKMATELNCNSKSFVNYNSSKINCVYIKMLLCTERYSLIKVVHHCHGDLIIITRLHFPIESTSDDRQSTNITVEVIPSRKEILSENIKRTTCCHCQPVKTC